MKKRSAVFLTLSVLLILVLAYLGAFGIKDLGGYHYKSFGEVINKGLDLQGGVSIVEQVTGTKPTAEVMQSTITRLEQRVNKLGVSETSVAQEGTDKIRIQVPGKFNSQDVVDTIGKTGKLRFVGPDNKDVITGSDVKKASVGTDSTTGKPVVDLQLYDAGAKKFAAATKQFLGQAITIYMDNDKIDAPTVNDVIPNGQAQISCTTVDEAKKLSNLISSGALPVTLKVAQQQVVGATLGATALPSSVRAGVVGIAIILVLMFLWYRRPGIMADFGLILFVYLVLALFVGINATLSLSGIAAFLLTVGMAVDANVLIFARIKEELEAGKSIKSATDAGFKNALSSIVDSNANTVIAGLVLYFVGAGIVKGFALTLIIGVLVSLFTALFVTKHLIRWALEVKLINKPEHFGVSVSKVKPKHMLKVVEKTKIWFAISLIIIITGISFMVYRGGLNLGLDFKGGTEIQMNIGKSFNKADTDAIVTKYVNAQKYTSAKANGDKQLNINIERDAITDANTTKLINDIKTKYKLNDSALQARDTIGATIGADLEQKAVTALAITIVCMLLFIAWRFEFKFGIAAIIALVHDVLVTLSVYSILNLQVDTAFVAAILTIIGYSISDTIVIFDRIRENQKKMRGKQTEEVADESISQTVKRSIYTVTTTLVAITCVHIFVPSVRNFTIPLIVGILSGCYSSIFIASPFWVIFKKHIQKKKTALAK